MSSAPLSSVFDLDHIQKLAAVRALARASMIRASDIEDLTETDGRLSAVVRGTMPYAAAIWVEGTKKTRFSCSCPQGEDGKFCKHAAAVGGQAVFLWACTEARPDPVARARRLVDFELEAELG
jgi:uncharacterized Zn finger protein